MATTLNQISDGVYALEQGMVRSFLILGEEKALLLDTGAEELDIMALIRTVTDKPVILVHTHGDGDHTAMDSAFPGLYAHPDEFPVILRFRPELKARLIPTHEGDVFDLGGRSLKVIEAPGHTPGSICLLDEENKILFSGDTVSYGPVFLFGDHRDIRGYRKTLDKLNSLGGYDVVYPCHNTCPVLPGIIPDLMACVDGALAGTLEPQENDMPMPPGMEAHVYSVGKCGILFP